ncbi:hypothetical protein LJC63_00340 [Ruminococcaceae bacterium OttesenSCG-928-L11]|nr:hypothetical protein [Ruminococcaceae bacterium OttesenSCG-928-L11]
MGNRIHFDFEGEHRRKSIEMLEYILCSSHWSGGSLPIEDEYIGVLMYLLHHGSMEVYERSYPASSREFSMEAWQRDQHFACMLGKREATTATREIMERFSKPDLRKKIHNALFYPEERAYIRCNGFPAERLFECFEDEECDKVIVFPEWVGPDGDNVFYTFQCADGVRRSKLREVLDLIRERRLDRMREISARMDKSNRVIPDIAKTE